MRILHAHSAASNDVRYADASGRIRALETTLLGRQRLERLAEAADIDEVLRLLSDTSYAAHLDELEDSGYEAFLENEPQGFVQGIRHIDGGRVMIGPLIAPVIGQHRGIEG